MLDRFLLQGVKCKVALQKKKIVDGIIKSFKRKPLGKVKVASFGCKKKSKFLDFDREVKSSSKIPFKSLV
jgi:hypothetical protein